MKKQKTLSTKLCAALQLLAEDLSVPQAAELLGISEVGVRKRIERAHKCTNTHSNIAAYRQALLGGMLLK